MIVIIFICEIRLQSS